MSDWMGQRLSPHDLRKLHRQQAQTSPPTSASSESSSPHSTPTSEQSSSSTPSPTSHQKNEQTSPADQHSGTSPNTSSEECGSSTKEHLIVTVLGRPRPKGSFLPIKTKSGRVFLKSSTQSSQYEAAIKHEAAVAMAGAPPADGAVSISVSFSFNRPRSHFGTGQFSNTPKAKAPINFTKKPDLDKLVRAVLDGLTGVAFADDAQVVAITAAKRYCYRENWDFERTFIEVTELP